ncbi:MAG: glycosyltransferase [bacterium]
MPDESTGKTAEEEFSVSAESEIPFPPRLAVGGGTPLLIGGWCRPNTRGESIEKIAISIDGLRSRAMSFGLPRKDVYRKAVSAGATGRDSLEAFKSGFAAIAEVPSRAAGKTVPVEVIATSHSGHEAAIRLGDLRLEPDPLPGPEVEWPEGEGGPRVAVCMATYSPDPDLFERQIESLKSQTHRNWLCFISDDEATSRSLELIEQTIGGDPRFMVSQVGRRLGFYSNFERALEMVPESADLIALADQDDRWNADKLSSLIGAVSSPGTTLAYSDARIVAEDGSVIHPSYWSLGRRNNHTNLASLIIANTITGAASIFKPEVLRLALPFPHTPVNSFHDHWIACVALAIGEIAYVDRPLYDYVQHGEAVIGFELAMDGVDKAKARPFRSFIATLRDTAGPRSSDPARISEIRFLPMNYYFGSTEMIVLAAAVRIRCGERMSRAKLRAVRRLETADTSTLSFLYLLARRFRRFVGLDETIDIERTRAKGLLWRRVIQVRSRLVRNPDRIVSDARIPMLEQARPEEAARL